MRLLQRLGKGVYKLTKELTGHEIPRYAILSHTWLLDNDLEVTFQDFTQRNPSTKPEGFAKLLFCGEQAARDGLEYFWVDTCCINKDSSAELQEAINTMFSWYRNAARCYVYLADVATGLSADTGTGEPVPSILWESAFRESRWFTRGWTLQELLAPKSVHFFSEDNRWLGDKVSLRAIIHDITGIPIRALSGDDLTAFTVHERLSWAKRRQTKREEDKVYCLLGLFNVFMPLIYGEGALASRRLREEIEKKRTGVADLTHFLDRIPGVTEAAFNSSQNQHLPTCLPQTRTALLHHIEEWAEGIDGRCVFWLNGTAGTGKSTVARTIARTYHNGQGHQKLGGSFFFSAGGGDLGKASMLAPTLARQLASRIPESKRHICEAIMEQEDIKDYSFRDQWEQLIIRPLSKLESISTVLFVIDALDECHDSKDIRGILRVLTAVTPLANIKVRIFLTSRPEPYIRNELQRIPPEEREFFVLHDITKDSINRDLGLYFEHRLSRLRDSGGYDDDWPGSRKVDRLVQSSSGLFIWAATACRFICLPRRRSMVDRRIDRLINGLPVNDGEKGPGSKLNSIYTTILNAFMDNELEFEDEQERDESYELLKKVLGSIVTLCSPLPMEPLARLIGEDLHDVRYYLTELNTIFQIPSEDSRPVYLHHPTFRDFLLNKERQNERFWVDDKEAHKAMGDYCLDVMSKHLRGNICQLKTPGDGVLDLQPSLIRHYIPPDLAYACTYWVEHYRQSGFRLSDGDRVHSFFKEHFLHWLEIMNIMGKSAEQGAVIRLYHALLHPRYNTRQIPFIKDARRLMFKFQNIIQQAPLQVYCSALMFLPPSNELWWHYNDQRHHCIKEFHIAQADVPKVKDEFNYVSDIAFTPDGTKVASGSNIAAVRCWDVATKSTICKYEGNASDKMSAIAISPNGDILAGGSDDFSVMAWNIKTGKLLYSIDAHEGWVNSVAFSPGGTILASASMDETIALWNSETGKLIKRFNNQSSSVNSATFSPDGLLIATGSGDELVRLWDISKPSEELKLTLDGHKGPVNCVQFALNGRQIASGSDDRTIKISNTTDGTCRITLRGHTKRVWAVAFSPDSTILASGSEDKTVRIWNTNLGTTLVTLSDHTSGLNSVSFSPDGSLFASGSFDDEVRLWNTANWALAGKMSDFEEDVVPGTSMARSAHSSSSDEKSDQVDFKGHSAAVNSLTFSPNGEWLASGSEDAVIKLWVGNKVHRTLHGHTGSVDHLEFSPDSKVLASGSSDKTLRVWKLATGSVAYILAGHTALISSVLFSPDGQLLGSSSGDRTARLWNPITGSLVSKLESHSGAVSGLVFSPDSRCVVTWSEDTTAVIWDVSSSTHSATLRGHSEPVSSVGFSADGMKIASCADDGIVCVWSREGLLRSRIACSPLAATVAALSPDAQLLAVFTRDKVIKIYSLLTESPVGSFGTDVSIRKLSFSSCGRYIKTDRGTVDVSLATTASSSLSQSHLNASPHSIFAAEEWLRLDMKNVLWLPMDFRALVVVTSDSSIVLGHSSGAVSFIDFV